MESVTSYLEKVEASAAFLKAELDVPRYAVLLGTGAQPLAEALSEVRVLSYADIPHFVPSTAPTHAARMQAGSLDGLPVLLLEGRYHYYEGYDMQQVTLPIRALGAAGVDTLLMTNAAGGLRPGMQKSDLMLISDHINLQPENPLRGQNLDKYGPRFPDMSTPYDTSLLRIAEQVAKNQKIRLQKGVYAAVQGPQLETPAEYAYLRQIGADAVGMSTVPEVLVARHMGLRCFAVSVISDLCYPGALEVVSVPKVLAAVAAATPQLQALLCGLLAEDQ